MKKFEETISSVHVYSGSIIHVYSNNVSIEGELAHREVIEHPGGVCVCALDENNHVYLVEQFRYGAQKFLLELPAGRLSLNENPQACASRELLEETGIIADEFTDLGTIYSSPAYNCEKIICFLATKLTVNKQNLDPGEYLDVIKYPLHELKAKVLNGEIIDAKTAYVILKVCAIKAV